MFIKGMTSAVHNDQIDTRRFLTVNQSLDTFESNARGHQPNASAGSFVDDLRAARDG